MAGEWKLVSAVSLAILVACAQARDSGSESHPEANVGWVLAQNTAQPELVLDGTDLVELSTFTTGPLGEDVAGEYTSEQGGSVLTLSIARQDDTHWTVERIYQEPELPEQKMSYLAEMRDGSLTSSNGDLMVKGTNEGVLVLELNSKNEAIPPDYWIHYIRTS
jgi:hypothetical protein